ncbi:endonuclease 4 [Tanacetum coccineum]
MSPSTSTLMSNPNRYHNDDDDSDMEACFDGIMREEKHMKLGDVDFGWSNTAAAKYVINEVYVKDDGALSAMVACVVVGFDAYSFCLHVLVGYPEGCYVDISLGWGKEGHYATCKIAQLNTVMWRLEILKHVNCNALARDNFVHAGYVSGCMDAGIKRNYVILGVFESFLTEEATKAVKELLPESEGNLSSVCSWPDEIKWMNKWRWTSELHYVDTPDFRCNYDYDRDCHDSSGVKDRCVTGAIYNYTEQLVMGYNASNSVTQYNLTEALMFLSHYIGDVHQVWDSDIIESAMKTFYDKDINVMISAIEKNITV